MSEATSRSGDDGSAVAAGSEVVRIDVPLVEGGYPVLVGTGWLDRLDDHLDVRALVPRAARALLVTQTPVIATGVPAAVAAALERAGIEVTRAEVPGGEGAKDVAVTASLWRRCAELPLTRDDLVVAVGGGVVGDLAGFVAATFNRGMAVLQVPTTLLAQVDAAIGGKTGINLPEGKNLVGAFHQPVAVACDVAVLGTLPTRVLVEGYGEVVKYGLIRDPVVLDRLEGAVAGVPDAEVPAVLADPVLLAELVARSVTVKATVVAADEREGGERAHLNLGHTYGHAVEALTGYGAVLHGEAVSIGMVVALRLGVRLGRTPPALVSRATALLQRLGLPVSGPALDRKAVWQVMARDKKALASGVRFVVLDDLAAPVVLTPERAAVDAVLDTLAGTDVDAPAGPVGS